MGIFSKLFSDKKKLSITNPVFGEIEYDDGVWTNTPSPGKEDFLLIIEALKHGPSKTQEEYYKVLKKRLKQLVIEAKKFIKDHQTMDVDLNTLGLYSIELGVDLELNRNNFVIELSDDQANEIHRVEFENNIPVRYGIDD